MCKAVKTITNFFSLPSSIIRNLVILSNREHEMDKLTVSKIQLELSKAGFDAGEIDGVWGRNTIAAVRAFQRSKNLTETGLVDTATFKSLISSSDQATNSLPMPPWLLEGERLSGVEEVSGGGNSRVILNWATELGITYSDDDIPWCGLFVAHCIAATMPKDALPNNPLGARQWEKFGDVTEPALGAIMIFWRETRFCGKGHVGFCTGFDNGAYRILGGNQNNKVSLAWVSESRFVTARWPHGASAIKAGSPLVRIDMETELSENEA